MIDSMVKNVLQNVTIKDVLEAINKKYGNKTALRIKNEDGSFREISYVKLGRRVVSISSVLINLGIKKGDRVLIVDDLLATGGTVKATTELVESMGGEVVGLAFLIELLPLKGREKLKGYQITSLIKDEYC